MASWEPSQNGVKICEFIRKDGRFFDVSYSASVLREDDEMVGLVVVFRDISDRKQAEADLRERDAISRNLCQCGRRHCTCGVRWAMAGSQ